MFKLGFNEATCKENSFVEKDLELCEKYGYEYIELRLDMLKDYLKDHTLEELKHFFDTHELKPFAFNSIEDINFTTPEEWKALKELFLFGCQAAQAIQNPYIIVVPTMTERIQQHTEKEVYEDSVRVLNELADMAKPYGVKLAFEPIGDRRWCCNSLRQAWEIVQAVDREDVGLTIDCINFYIHDKCADVEYITQIPKEKIFVFHMNDCEDLPFGVLDHCHRIMPGKGCIPVAEIAGRIEQTGYDEIASLELFRPEYWEMEAEDVIAMGAEACSKFL